MDYTANYNLKKPATSDYYNVEDDNDNMDIIDGELNSLSTNKLEKSGGEITDYTENLVTLSGTTPAVDLSQANVFAHTLSGNTTYSFTNAASGVAHSFTLIFTQPATPVTVSFPASVKWQGGTAPTMNVAEKTYLLTFLTIDGGTTWLGIPGGEF